MAGDLDGATRRVALASALISLSSAVLAIMALAFASISLHLEVTTPGQDTGIGGVHSSWEE